MFLDTESTSEIVFHPNLNAHPRGKGPAYELFRSLQRAAVVNLVKSSSRFFVLFLGWVMFPNAQVMSTAYGALEPPFTHLDQFNSRRRNVVLEWRIVSPNL